MSSTPLFILLTLVAASAITADISLNLGIMLPRIPVDDANLAKGIIIATELAIKRIQDEGVLNSSFKFTYTEMNTWCNKLIAVEQVFQFRNLSAFIGPACTVSCVSAGLLAATLNTPMISYSCSSIDLSDRQFYPTFARTQPYTRTYIDSTPHMVLEMMKHFQWSRLCIIATEDAVWPPLATKIKTVLTDENMTVPYTGLFTVNSKLNYETVLKPVSKTCRIVLFLAFSEDVARLLYTADSLGMRNNEYAFMTLDFNIEERYKAEDWPNVTKEEVFATFEGVLDMAVRPPEGPKFTQTYNELKSIILSRGMKIINQTISFGSFVMDAIFLYAYGVNMTIEKGLDYKDGRALITTISINKKLFEGVTGPVGISSKGNRVPIFVFSNRKSNVMVPHATFNLLKSPGDEDYFTVINSSVVVFPGGSTKRPLDVPVCGFDGAKCRKPPEGLSDLYFLLLLIPVVLIIICIAGFLYYRKKIYENDLLSSRWLIPYRQLTFVSADNRFSTSKLRSRASLASSMGFSNNMANSVNIGRVRGELVVIKRLRKDQVHLSREVLIDMKQVRDLHHPNLVPYIGVCVEHPNICIISMFCNRGSLQDILANDDIKLDWMFRQSFANDIVSGMEALHNSTVHVHGNLKSSNCLIDSRWACRIGDYGLELFRENQREKDIGEHAKYREMMWTAPEHLLQKNNRKTSTSSIKQAKSQSGDIYSFAIILYELVTRDEPYTNNEDTLTPKEIIDRVASRSLPLYRPQLPKSVIDLQDQRILLIIHDCWDDDPNRRPTFNAIKKRLKLLVRGKNSNIVDNMIAMMEKYTDQLEMLVDERTKELAAEKAKTDELLYKMLPRSIADQLKKGNSVAAESFTSVTIFFSDIVGFTSVAAQSTPFQVVDLLNALYTCFDKVVDEHDVYKVETIGDAYMIVSGLPVRNENRHAGEIATTALDLLSAVRDFQIPHIPSKRVQLRIGIHTGPCVAGVVGLKMPRYCLFGDTVNYASRMESSGLALRIHVSPECREVLEVLGGYHLKERGPVSMKGKGTIVTFFLIGKEGFDKPLPDLRDALPPEAHEFK